MTKTDILKNGVRSTKKYCYEKQQRLIETPTYFGGGHYMLKKDCFPDEYQVFKNGINYVHHARMTDKAVKKAFANKSGELKLFEPTKHDDYTLQDDHNNRFNSKYYWHLCKVLGCSLYFGDYLTPVTIKKGHLIVGYAMGMATDELGHRKAKAA